jgi:hypothetical protein
MVRSQFWSMSHTLSHTHCASISINSCTMKWLGRVKVLLAKQAV